MVFASLLSFSTGCVCSAGEGKDRCVVQADCLSGFTCINERCLDLSDGGVGGGTAGGTGGGTGTGGAGGGETMGGGDGGGGGAVSCDAGDEEVDGGGGSGGDADGGLGLPDWAQLAYLKASNTGRDDHFGSAVALSGDGSTLAVGAPAEDSAIGGINGNQFNNVGYDTGAVYVFRRSASGWAQEAYVKASNPRSQAEFGFSLALSTDGATLAVGASLDDDDSTGSNGNPATHAINSGAVYVFQRTGSTWSQQAYLKASNPGAGDQFGYLVALSGNGNTLAVTAPNESSSAKGINGDQTDDSTLYSGAAYVFRRDRCGWTQRAYVKASNTGAADGTGVAEGFGMSLALSSDGNTLAVGAIGEASNATGIDGNQQDTSALSSGAVYVFRFAGSVWAQEAYVKASNTGSGDRFGGAVTLSGDGSLLAVGASWERSRATGINGDQADNTAPQSGAAYLFRRSGSTWSQEAYLKASNTEGADYFGSSLSLSADGSTIAVGARYEGSNANGINGNQLNNSLPGSGAVYVFRRPVGSWAQVAYVKASNRCRWFGDGALSADGRTFVGGARFEDSNATGVNGDQADTSELGAGAAYVFRF